MPYKILDPSLAAAAPVVTIGAPLTSVGDTLTTFLDELDLELGDRDDYDTTRAKKWINWAYRHVAAMVDLTEMHAGFSLSTVSAQFMYNLPSSVAWIDGVAVADTVNYFQGGRAFLKTDLATFRKMDDLTNTASSSVNVTNLPQYFFRHNRLLVLWPTPGDAWVLSVDCKVRPDDLVLATDSPMLPTEWHEGIQLYATHRGMRSLKMYKEAAVMLNSALEAVRPMLDTDAEEKATIQAHLSPARELRDIYRKSTGRRNRWRYGGN